jgi:anti-sigma factor RsiW
MQALDDDQLGALIRREGSRHAPSAALADRIRADLRGREAPAPSTTRSLPARWLQALALFGAGAATAWGLALALLVAPMAEATGDALTDSHVRSLMGAHLADVASSDHHTVKPWFAGKLDFSPPVVDLASDGLPLAGGRLDYVDGHPVAALVYRSGPHVINLFVWPAGDAKPQAPQQLVKRGYNLVHWTQAGMQAWAVSDLNAAELKAFADRASQRMATTTTP